MICIHQIHVNLLPSLLIIEIGKRTVPKYECYIQFIETNQYITFGTAIAAFYVPGKFVYHNMAKHCRWHLQSTQHFSSQVTVMCILYYRIWRETKKRQKDLPNLQAGGGGGHQSIKKDSSKRSNSRYVIESRESWLNICARKEFVYNWKTFLLLFSFLSDETSTINHQIGEYIDPNFWHPPHLAGDNESNSYYSGAHPHSIHDLSRRTSVSSYCIVRFSAGDVIRMMENFSCRQNQTISNRIRLLKA